MPHLTKKQKQVLETFAVPSAGGLIKIRDGTKGMPERRTLQSTAGPLLKK